MRNIRRDIKVTYRYRWDNPTPEQLKESQRILDSVYDFIFERIDEEWGLKLKRKPISKRVKG